MYLVMKNLSIIVAIDDYYGISKNDVLPWYNEEDLKHFKQITKDKILIMGKKTWLSIPNKTKFQKDRICFVLSSQYNDEYNMNDFDLNHVYYIKSYDVILQICMNITDPLSPMCRDVFIIGGKSLYEKSFDSSFLKYIYITRIKGDYKCDNDIKFIQQHLDYRCIHIYTEMKDTVTFQKYKVISEEDMYLKLLSNVYYTGIERNDRTGIGTYSKFGSQLSFSLKDNKMPLLTTKKTYWKGIVHELLWFLNGNTNSKILEDKNVNIWKGNSTREFLDKLGFNDREVGDLGPVYGFQWRHWGAEYETMNTNYQNKGIDQLQNIVETIRKDPSNRRLILSAWNVKDIKEMALPPCHMMCQFYVDESTSELSCQLYQRSADLFLGVPFNIASYALLTHIIAKIVGLTASRLNIVFGDVHIYKTHLDAVKTQITRSPFDFPTISIQKDISNVSDLSGLSFEDIELNSYKCHASIFAPMSV